MKKKILSCLLAVMMLASLFAVPVSAATVVTIDTGSVAPNRGSNQGTLGGGGVDGYYIANGANATGVWYEYDIDIPMAGMYSVEIGHGGYDANYSVTVNGTSAGYTSWTKLSAGQATQPAQWAYWWACNDQVYLTAGVNTVKVQIAGTANHTFLAGLRFTRTGNVIVEDNELLSLTYLAKVVPDLDVSIPLANALDLGCIWENTDQSVTVTFGIEIPEGGMYEVKEVSGTYTNANIYIKDGSEVVATVRSLTDPSTENCEEYGEIGGSTRYWCSLGAPIQLDAGTYTVEYVSEAGSAFRFTGLRFDEVPDTSSVTADIYHDVIVAGDATKLSIRDANDKSITFNRIPGITFKAENSYIAIVDADGNVTGGRPGKTNIVITTTQYGSFTVPVTVTASNGLEVDAYSVKPNGDIEIKLEAFSGEEFDIVIATYDRVAGNKSSLRSVFGTRHITATGGEQTITFTKPDGVHGEVYEIYMWETADGMIPVYQKIVID